VVLFVSGETKHGRLYIGIVISIDLTFCETDNLLL
jgi:hypothetical protein